MGATLIDAAQNQAGHSLVLGTCVSCVVAYQLQTLSVWCANGDRNQANQIVCVCFAFMTEGALDFGRCPLSTSQQFPDTTFTVKTPTPEPCVDLDDYYCQRMR